MESFRRPLPTFLVLLVFIILVSSCDNTINLPNDTPTDGITMYWQGELESYPTNPQEGYAFYNTLEKTSYIYANGKWDTLAKGGSGLVWLGEYSAYPSSPQNGDAFYHTLLGNSYVYNGSSWELLARRGSDGQNGLFNWIGSFPIPPEDPEDGWAYHNDTDGISYIFTNGEWKIFSYDGQSLIWLGELHEAPTSPSVNMAYFNTTENMSYIWNGSSWSILTGTSDVYYTVSIRWKGNFASAPDNPDIGWMYYNSSIGKSYVWTGSVWEVVASDGISPVGFLIQWKGPLTADPDNPQIGWAYHNTENNSTYLYDGTKWCLMVQGENVLSSLNTAKMQVKVDGEIISPSQSIPLNYSGSEITVEKIIEVSNIGSEILFFSDSTPLFPTFRGNVEVDTSGYKNSLNPGESFSIVLTVPTGQYFTTTINFYNSSLDSPWYINIYNLNYSIQYINVQPYFYPYFNSSSYQSSKSLTYYGSNSQIADNPSNQVLDFGSTITTEENVSRYRFNISVYGSEPVHLPGNPAIYISGPDADCFQVSTVSNINITLQPSSNIDLFSVIFTPDTPGDKTAILHIPTDLDGVGEIQIQLIGSAVDALNLFIENGFAPSTFSIGNPYPEKITSDGNGGLYLLNSSYQIKHMDCTGNIMDEFSIATGSGSIIHAEFSSNLLKIYTGSYLYSINTTTHSHTRTNFIYTANPQTIDDEPYWRVFEHGTYKLGINSRDNGIIIIYDSNNEIIATYYSKLPSTYLADACVSDKYLYFVTFSSSSIIRRIDLDELFEEMSSVFF